MKPENKLTYYTSRYGISLARDRDDSLRIERMQYRRNRDRRIQPSPSMQDRFHEFLNSPKVHPKGTLVGVEIECLTPNDTPRSTIPGVECVCDGSVSSASANKDWQECRFFLRKGQWGRLYSLCDWLNNKGATVNSACGLHVHLDCRDKTLEEATQVAIRLARALPLLKALVPKSRLENSYCANGYSFSDRYHMINGLAMREHGTIEVRLHSGSTNPDKIRNWIELLLFITSTSSKIVSLDALLSSRCPPALKIWVVQRYAQFNPITGTTLELNERSN